MEEKHEVEFDSYEKGIVINALNHFRNDLLNEKRDSSSVDEVLLKIIRAKGKRRRRHEREVG